MATALSDKFSRLVKQVSGQARITEANVQDMLREVRMALLEADVALLRDDRPGTVGGPPAELAVRGPHMFAGYWNRPEETEAAFVDGTWFRTGDVLRVDDDGWAHVVDRVKDMYISGGSNVYPREAEEKLLKHPAIAEAAILGVPDPAWGEVGVAVCVARPGAEIGEAELIAWLAGEVARYKLPKRVFFWEALPRSGYGKVTKRAIREGLEASGCLPFDPGAPAGR